MITKYVRNENLPTIKSGWQGTPVDEKGRFVNAELPFLSKTKYLLKWQLSRNPQAEEKQKDASRLEIRDPDEFFDGEKDGILWLGHAGFFMRLAGIGILLDPVFGNPLFVKTY